MSGASAAGFELDARLANDAVFVADWPLSRLLLMDDARFPWLVLVPRRAGLVELLDLDEPGYTQLMWETRRAMKTLRAAATCDKLNVGALGNVVHQLHVHVVARRQGDAAWPEPVWGAGAPQPYALVDRDALLARLRDAA